MSRDTPHNDIIMYIKGYTPQGIEGQCYHVHVRKSGDWGDLYFRDYFAAHDDIAREYETLKLKLMEEYCYDSDGYTDAKGDFVRC